MINRMTVFGDYASYYDLLYAEKDYQAECSFVISLLENFKPEVRSLLELGCGTGRHTEVLARRGLAVTAVDRSPEMLRRAQRRMDDLPPVHSSAVRLIESDIGRLSVDGSFDAAISLFHTIGYLTDNEALDRTFSNVRGALKDGGLFVFDFWYGPAVLRSLPETRIRRLQSDGFDLLRVAEPRMDVNDDCVEVAYEIHWTEIATSRTTVTRENHRVRYFFLPALKQMLAASGFEFLTATRWLANEPPSAESWNVCVVARAVAG
jgi:SAM-dependent methyltransferase